VTIPVYPIEAFWSAEDEPWVANVPDLRYCSAVGDNPPRSHCRTEGRHHRMARGDRCRGSPDPVAACSRGASLTNAAGLIGSGHQGAAATGHRPS
jgi:hypothetical protein